MRSAIVLALAAAASAKVISVQVGGSGLVFTPDSVTADKGDQLSFTIGSTHNVAQSTFDAPCKPIGSNAIYSGNNVMSFVVTVNSTDPLYFYCATGHHCQSGMVMVVNPASNEGIDAFKKAASTAGAGVAPSAVQGGVVNGQASGGSSGSMSGSMMSGSMASSMSGSMTGSGSMAATTSMGGSASMSASGMSGGSAAATGGSSTATGGSSTASHGEAAPTERAGYMLAAGLLMAANFL